MCVYACVVREGAHQCMFNKVGVCVCGLHVRGHLVWNRGTSVFVLRVFSGHPLVSTYVVYVRVTCV